MNLAFNCLSSTPPRTRGRSPHKRHGHSQADDGEIRELIIGESVASYPGNCPCPYFADRAGRRCGGRSAYSRAGGYSPLCYPNDVTDQIVTNYRTRFKEEKN
jgi:hypothetical protein